jgi:hypothetical protein
VETDLRDPSVMIINVGDSPDIDPGNAEGNMITRNVFEVIAGKLREVVRN